MPYDRNEVLGRTDLGELADQLIGPHKGRGAGATWPCPDAGHGNQTGKTPPVSIFRTGYGDERWRCHSCGAGGTAIDLVMMTQGVRFPEAIELLARRAGVAEFDKPMPALRTAPIRRVEPVPEGRPNPDVERFVAAAEGYLWSEQGQPMQRWLAERGLGQEVLRANRIGADPGPAGLERARGLPRGGPAVILPVLAEDGSATYLQSRYLNPNGHKYDNPSAALAGALPRTAEVRLPRPPRDPDLVVVAEGIPDALVAAQAGYRAAAVLGAGVPDERTAAALVERHPTERLLLAFDADGPGQAGADRLQELLAQRGAAKRVARLEVPASAGDLNAWQLSSGAAFGDELATAIARSSTERDARMATDRLGPERPVATETVVIPGPAPDRSNRPSHADGGQAVPSLPGAATPSGAEYVAGTRPSPRQPADTFDRPAQFAPSAHVRLSELALPEDKPVRGRAGLIDDLETIWYQHVLVDDAALSGARAARIEQALSAWTTPFTHAVAANDEHRQGLAELPAMSGMQELDQRLAQLAYRYLEVDDPSMAVLNLKTATSTVERLSTMARPAIGAERYVNEPDLAAAQRWAFDHGLAATPDFGSPSEGLASVELDGLAIEF